MNFIQIVNNDATDEPSRLQILLGTAGELYLRSYIF